MRKGFSLLEIMLSVSILAIFTGISLTAVSSYALHKQTQVQQNLITTDINYAKDLAQTLGLDSYIVFSADTYTIRAGQNTKQIRLNPGYTLSPQQLGYTPQGTPKYSRTIFLYYHNKQLSKLTVAIGSGILKWQKL